MSTITADNLIEIVEQAPLLYVVEDNPIGNNQDERPEENYENYVLAENAEEREFYSEIRVSAMYKRFFGDEYKQFI